MFCKCGHQITEFAKGPGPNFVTGKCSHCGHEAQVHKKSVRPSQLVYQKK